MPDFAMCSHVDCPMAKTCLRNTKSGMKIKPHNQAWFEPKPMGAECKFYKEKKP